MSEPLKTILIVTVVSVLIWIYAEGESITNKTISITLTLPGEPANLSENALVVWFEGADPRAIQTTITVEGSQTSIDRLEDILQTPIDLTRSREFPALDPGTQEVQLLPVLRAHPALGDRAVTVTAVDPPIYDVSMARLQSRQLDVEVRLPDGFQIAGPVRVEPERVTLYVPQRDSRPVPLERTISTVLPREQVAALAPGIEHVIEGISLSPPPAVQGENFVRIDPPAVSARFTLETTQDEHVIPSVYFWTLIPESETGKWNIDIEGPGFLRDVTVIGPGDQIALLKADPPGIDVRAIIELSADDLLRRVEVATARFSPLPSTLRFEPAEVEVQLNITPVDEGEAATPPDQDG